MVRACDWMPAAGESGAVHEDHTVSPTESRESWQCKLHEIIFESDTRLGKLFDVAVLAMILASLVVVCLESVQSIWDSHQTLLRTTEWTLTILFTIEYVLRLLSVRHRLAYATSFFGVVDLLAILPTYLSLLFPGAGSLVVIRMLRLVRVFRVFKLMRYVRESQVLSVALQASRPKIIVFLLTVSVVVTIIGSLMYLVEPAEAGFSSIPMGMYWAIVTMTTVGYGDITPVTPLGKALAALVMIIGYGVIAVPTGIVSAEIAQAGRDFRKVDERACGGCGQDGQMPSANYCHHCGDKMPPPH